MIRKRVPKLLTILATAACIFGFVLVAPADTPTLSPMPTAGAQPMGNGYDATCTKANDNQVTCNISGCPRVHEDLAGDSLNYTINGGEQQNIPKSCGNTSTVNVNSSGAFTLSFQGCRGTGLFDTNSGSCGAWADYKYEPPAKPVEEVKPVVCPAGSKTQTVIPPAQCEAAPETICPDGSVTPKVPADQKCQPPSKAISMNITKGGGNADIKITNSSGLPVDCAYTANKTAGLFGDDQYNLNIKVDAHSTATNSDLIYPIGGIRYNATVKCTGTWDGQVVVVGEASQSVP